MDHDGHREQHHPPADPGHQIHHLVTDHVVAKAVAAHHEYMARCERPADLRNPLVLTAAQPTATDYEAEYSKSIGVLNPNAVEIYWGIGRAVAQPGQRAIAQPPKSLMVLPLQAQDFTVGADPADLAAGAATVFLLRFETVQTCFMGAVA